MKRTMLLLALLGWARLASAALSFQTPVNQPIPDGDPSGLASVLTLSGQTGAVSDLTVGLSISGTWNGDLYAYLTHGPGFTILLNRPGRSLTDSVGYGDSGLDVEFQTGAPNIHFYQPTLGGPPVGELTGAWSPDGRAVSPYAVNGSETPTALLSSFDGVDPNGDWTLFVADVSGGDANELVSWRLIYTAAGSGPVPEAAGYWALLPLLALLLSKVRRAPAGPAGKRQ